MRVEQEKVRLFMEMIGDDVADTPRNVDSLAIAERRYNLIGEELEEYLDAVVRDDLVGIADALGDLLYTVLGLAVLHGMDAQPIFDEVHRSNMTKEPRPDDPIKKCAKGEAFQKPRIAELLLLQRTGLDVSPL